MSLNAMRALFHSKGLGVVLLTIVTLAMLVTAYTGIGSILKGNSAAPGAAQSNSPDSAVATVDGVPITRQQFDEAYNSARQNNTVMAQQQGVWVTQQNRMQALQGLIQQAEMVKIAQNAGVTASSSDVDAERSKLLAPIRKTLGLPANASEDDINNALQAASAPPLNQLYPDSSLKQQALVTNYQNAIEKQVVASDADVQRYYRQTHVRLIEIGVQKRPDAQAEALATIIIGKLQHGADFTALAKQYSDDPTTKSRGGDDGWVSVQRYVPEFIKPALSMNVGQITPKPVYVAETGYYILQVVGTRETLPKDFAKNQAKYQIQASKYLQAQIMQNATDAESKSAKIVIHDPLLRAYYDMSQPNSFKSPSIAADFHAALATADSTTKGEIYAQLAMIDLTNFNTKAEIEDLKNAITSREDAQLRLLLGEAYMKEKDKTDAKTQFANASSDAFDNSSIHMELQTDYKQIGEPKLAASEQDWMTQFAERQKANLKQVGAIPGGVPMTTSPSGAPVPINIPAPPAIKTAALKPATKPAAK